MAGKHAKRCETEGCLNHVSYRRWSKGETLCGPCKYDLVTEYIEVQA